MSNDNIFRPRGSNLLVFGATDEQQRIMRGREEFVEKYCAERGWDMNSLEMSQMLEIRAQPGWKNPQETPTIVRPTPEEIGTEPRE